MNQPETRCMYVFLLHIIAPCGFKNAINTNAEQTLIANVCLCVFVRYLSGQV